jgi:glycosyltransferase involved in cell wall biosynthesis
MRILMISKACVVGTYQRKLEEMARLPGVELSVIVPPVWRDPSGDLRLERVHVQGYTMFVDPMRFNGNFHLHYFPTIARRLHDTRPDIVHIDEEPYNVATWHALWLARRAGAKTLFFSWQNIVRQYPFPFSIGERWALRTIDHAIAGTDSAAEVWQAKGYRGPMKIIPQFGIDPEIFAPVERRLDGRGFVIGYVGRLVPEKGVDLLIRALAELPQQSSPWRLEIVGQGSERESLIRLARSLNLADRISFTGQVPSGRIPALYRELDALVVPSRTRPNWKEQFGRIIIEAMASGVPVIGSDSGAIPGVIGDAGLIFPEDNTKALAACLSSLMQDEALQCELAARGRARALEHFTHAQVAAQTVDVYREMLR